MSYTQWDKGFLEGWKSGREAGLRAVREELLNRKNNGQDVPIEYFELLNDLDKEAE